MAANVVCKITCRRLGINWDINEKRSADVVTTLAQCFALITFEVLNQTPLNLLGSCRSSSRWCLQNYMKNGWELTSELTSKWIYIFKYWSKFHTNLINNFWNTCSNFTEFTGQWPDYHTMVPAKLHGRRLRIDVWINVWMNNFWNTQSNLPLISLITSEVLAQILQNLQGTR